MPNNPDLRGPVPLAHTWLRNLVRTGDTVVDATCGNGHDTLLLAQLVGETGRVWAFDIQEDAIRKTSALIEQAGLAERVRLVRCGHQYLAEHLDTAVAAVVFNLGYLPGGDRNIATGTETTITALDQAIRLLKPGGIAAITVYPGHDSGKDEACAVKEWAAALAPRTYHSWLMGQQNVPATAPYFILIQKAP